MLSLGNRLSCEGRPVPTWTPSLPAGLNNPVFWLRNEELYVEANLDPVISGQKVMEWPAATGGSYLSPSPRGLPPAGFDFASPRVADVFVEHKTVRFASFEDGLVLNSDSAPLTFSDGAGFTVLMVLGNEDAALTGVWGREANPEGLTSSLFGSTIGWQHSTGTLNTALISYVAARPEPNGWMKYAQCHAVFVRYTGDNVSQVSRKISVWTGGTTFQAIELTVGPDLESPISFDTLGRSCGLNYKGLVAEIVAWPLAFSAAQCQQVFSSYVVPKFDTITG